MKPMRLDMMMVLSRPLDASFFRFALVIQTLAVKWTTLLRSNTGLKGSSIVAAVL